MRRDFIAKQKQKDATNAKITCAVSIGPREGGGLGLAARLRVKEKTLAHIELDALAKEAHEKMCPYSHATRGNVDVQSEVVGVQTSGELRCLSVPRAAGFLPAMSVRHGD
jgi:lipoyl-dependent peroxiredoxin